MFALTFHAPMLSSLAKAQQEDPKVGVRGTEEHREFVEAVARRDVATAERVMREHLARTADRLKPHM
jgi:DNA-binding GntR family transcriptional regulator